MGYQADFEKYNNTGRDRSQMFAQAALKLRCPNPVCDNDINVYDATGDEFSIDLDYKGRMDWLDKARCTCGMPLIYRKNDEVYLSHWDVDRSRAAIMVTIAPHHTDHSFSVPPVLIRALDQIASAAAMLRGDTAIHNRHKQITGLAMVIHQWMNHDVEELVELAARHCEDANQHTLAALLRGEVPEPQSTRYARTVDNPPLARLVFKLPMNAVLYAEMVSAFGDPQRSGHYLRFTGSEGTVESAIKTTLDPAGARIVDRVGEL